MVLIFQGIFVYSAFMECLQLIGIVKTEMVRGGGRPQGAHGMQTGAATRKVFSGGGACLCVLPAEMRAALESENHTKPQGGSWSWVLMDE